MPLLVYCIMSRPVESSGVITGVKDTVVSLVESGTLWAAVSDTPTQDGAPPVSDLLVYGEVVEALHRRTAVIPMRYGCFVAGIPELRRLLQEKEREHRRLLDELEGQVEMGIRILLPEPAQKPPEQDKAVTGRDYLAVRRAHYGVSEEASRRHRFLVDRYHHALEGLYSQSRTETDERGGRVMISLYYLVPEPSVGRFKDACGRTVVAAETKALVSGPWPPYNFVTCQLVPAEGTGPEVDR